MAEIDDKVLKEIAKLLNNTISNSLYGGGGDPGWGELASAATSVKILQLLDLEVKDQEDVFRELKEENICDENFLKTFKIKE